MLLTQVRSIVAVLGLCALYSPFALAQTLSTLEQNGPPETRIDIVIIGDGYRVEDQDEFLSHAEALRDFIFDENRVENRPFPEYRAFFNVHALFVPSVEAGVEVNGEDELNTVLEALMDVDGDDSQGRRISINTARADGFIDDLAFEADMIFVPINTNLPDRVGGGADGRYAIYNADFAGQNNPGNTALHEMGHAFADLADEYTESSGEYPPTVFGILDPNGTDAATPSQVSCGGQYYDSEFRPSFPEEFANLARSADLVPWSHWIGFNSPFTGTVGAFEGGGNTYTSGVFRPSNLSKMNQSYLPFDPVSMEEILLHMYKKTGLTDFHTPEGKNLADVWEIDTRPIEIDNYNVTWTVNGDEVSEESGTLSLCGLGLETGQHSIAVKLIDNTSYLRTRQQVFISPLLSTAQQLAGPPSRVSTPLRTSKGDIANAVAFSTAYSQLPEPRMCPADYARKTDIADREVTFEWTINLTQTPKSGTPQDDTLTTDRISRALCGFAGDDTLSGAVLNDSLFGGADNDVLTGGGGADVLVGGPGADIFQLNDALESSPARFDVIEDFVASEGDKLDVSGAFGGPFLAGTVPVGQGNGYIFIGSQPFSGNRKEVRVLYRKDGSIDVLGDVDADGNRDFKIKLRGPVGQTIDRSSFVGRSRRR